MDKHRQTLNLIRRKIRGKRIGCTLIIRESEYVGMYHPLDVSTEEAYRWYKLCVDKVNLYIDMLKLCNIVCFDRE